MVDAKTEKLLDIDWSKLPIPQDDGAAAKLAGRVIPDIALPATSGRMVCLAHLTGTTVLYCYPMTGAPGVEVPESWNEIPGARGCTPQSCAFRDSHAELISAGANQVFGLSAQTNEEQVEAAERLHLPFPLLSDDGLRYASALGLPTFYAAERTLIKRISFVIENARIVKVFYPIFPPHENPQAVLEYLKGSK